MFAATPPVVTETYGENTALKRVPGMRSTWVDSFRRIGVTTIGAAQRYLAANAKTRLNGTKELDLSEQFGISDAESNALEAVLMGTPFMVEELTKLGFAPKVETQPVVEIVEEPAISPWAAFKDGLKGKKIN